MRRTHPRNFAMVEAYRARQIRKLAKTMSISEICNEIGIFDAQLRQIAAKFRIEFPVTAVGTNQFGQRKSKKEDEKGGGDG